MRLKTKKFFILIILKSTLTYQEEKTRDRLLDLVQNIFSDVCDIKKIQLPDNGEKWICEKQVSYNAVPKNTKCWLQCKDGYKISIG